MARVRRPEPARVAALVLLGALSACRSLPPAATTFSTWSERCAALTAREGYSFSGRIAARSGGTGFSAGIDWRQQGGIGEATLRGPLGVGGVRARIAADGVQILDAGGQPLPGAAGDDALRELLGFTPPLAELRYWLLACAAPGSPAAETADEVQRLASLEQSGWRLEYPQYQAQSAPYTLPARIRVRRGEDSLQLAISRWTLR